MTDWFADTVLSGSLLLAVPIAVLAGLVSFFSPCVLPLLPGYLSYVSGVGVQDLETKGRSRLLLGSVLFVLGFTVVFVTGGALFGALGQELYDYRRTMSVVLGIVVIVLGLVFSGVLPILQRDVRVHAVPAVGVAVAPLLGLFFGLGWLPCIGPTLGAVLTLANNSGTLERGAFLTFVYCLGLGVPFVLAALGFGRFMHAVRWARRHQQTLQRVGGGLLVVVGVLLVTGVWDAVVVQLQTWAGGYGAAI
ncbi:cytochrome c-type biogenesis protein [Aeromicrobium sp. SORGH_AS981]|uniref:cytochrome c biogenesis CcdA family protein n=1 Tax=Aeromicrobium sp. SORGH_AS_0981 TaxID=3041802 RepID=UPI002860090A|nr:cytochrome c biogenesis protein CcdA [Aeromicrobium sp. SORGH_AS_0981]MDR6118544.1 cytochrome c-type biogenesis protein [Aeromicrobium sp. SORGH_AS_0981]